MNVSSAVPAARHATSASVPWYREPWPWLLAAGPVAVILAGIVTTYLAFASADGLVADDYYKRGLAINRDLARTKAARDLGLVAAIRFDRASERVTVQLSGASPRLALPPAVELRVIHPARAEGDRRIVLPLLAAGAYEGRLALPTAPRLRVALETADWRLMTEWTRAHADELHLSASEPVDRPPDRR
jgi:hypothetical protein